MKKIEGAISAAWRVFPVPQRKLALDDFRKNPGASAAGIFICRVTILHNVDSSFSQFIVPLTWNRKVAAGVFLTGTGKQPGRQGKLHNI